MFNLSGQTALVTGASGGIGSAVAKALAARGARVALSGTREDALKAVAAEIGGDCIILPCNLSDPEAVDGLIPRAVEALGKLDDPEGFPEVEAALNSNEMDTRNHAAAALGAIRTPAAEALAMKTLDDGNLRVRLGAAISLFRMSAGR